VQPIYFGKAGKQLFGAYHPPQARRPGIDAVVLCYPLPQEYMRTHWAMRKLASGLAREGVHVMRFDYLGTGDSAGGAEHYSAAQWCADIKAAVAELLDLSGARKVSLVGLRFGATLAAVAASSGLSVKDLVLWEPAASGGGHLAELENIEKIRHRNAHLRPQKGPDELLAHAVPPSLREELGRIDLSRPTPCAADRICIFAQDPRPDHAAIGAGLRDRGDRPPELTLVPEEARDRQSGVLLSSKVLQAITAGLTRGAA
jgi:pimeloyl-ACP methyl ester carboxylesterase